MTIRLIILFLERPLVELFKTKGTHKMFGVKFLEHGSDAAPRNGFLTAGTEGAAPRVVVGLAVWKTFVVIEWSGTEGHVALLGKEWCNSVTINNGTAFVTDILDNKCHSSYLENLYSYVLFIIPIFWTMLSLEFYFFHFTRMLNPFLNSLALGDVVATSKV